MPPTPRFVAAPRRMPGPRGTSSAVREPRSAARRAFTLVELLVVVSIILVLMGLMATALSAARGSQKKQATQALIAKLDTIIQQQYSTYATRSVGSSTSIQARSLAIRRLLTSELPDRWTDVKYIASPSQASEFSSSVHRTYIAIWNSLPAAKKLTPGDENYDKAVAVCEQYGGAECLFMAVMRAGIGDCLDCGSLTTSQIGDKDQDGMPEFWDAWGNPIGLILWPAAFELPIGSGTRFFSQAAPFSGGTTDRSMAPLIYSAGPDGEYAFNRGNEDSYLRTANCGDPALAPMSSCGTPAAGASDNITNFDAEAKK